MHAVDVTAQTRALAAEDLNLVVALHALLSTASVTEAAARLGRTQPATSHALSRLRALFGDPLLVRSGRGLVRTPRAEALLPDAAAALDAVHRLLSPPERFDARTSTRTFTLACPDLLMPFVPGLLARLSAAGPRVRVALEPQREATLAELAAGRVDLVLGAASDATGVRRALLGRVDFVVAARRGHPALRGTWSLERWLAHPHVVVQTGNGTPNRLAELLEARGLVRDVGLSAPGFLAALHVAAATDLFLAAPRAAIEALAEPLGLAVLPLPVPLPKIPVAAFWHERAHRDAGHAWLRQHVTTEVRERLA